MRVEEEAKTRCERVDVKTAVASELDVGDAVSEREGELLRGCRTGFANVVPADADRVELGRLLLRPLRGHR